MLKILMLASVLLIMAVAGLAIRLFFDRKAEFRSGSCSSSSPGLKEQGISCGCGAGSCAETDKS